MHNNTINTTTDIDEAIAVSGEIELDLWFVRTN